MRTERQRLVIGNWKMNGSRAQAAQLVGEVRACLRGSQRSDVAICVPYPLLATCEGLLLGSAIGLGAQDLSPHAQGAHTGEVSGAMLRDFGCRFVIVGHSERRTDQRETDALVAAKAGAALAAGLTPVICVGETLEDRDAGRAEPVILQQVAAALAGLDPEQWVRCVLAYEPVWAIGTGRTATPQQAQDIHAAVRTWLRQRNPAAGDVMRILYGGSVKVANAPELFRQDDIDGGLIGGASLVADEFAAIASA